MSTTDEIVDIVQRHVHSRDRILIVTARHGERVSGEHVVVELAEADGAVRNRLAIDVLQKTSELNGPEAMPRTSLRASAIQRHLECVGVLQASDPR